MATAASCRCHSSCRILFRGCLSPSPRQYPCPYSGATWVSPSLLQLFCQWKLEQPHVRLPSLKYSRGSEFSGGSHHQPHPGWILPTPPLPSPVPSPPCLLSCLALKALGPDWHSPSVGDTYSVGKHALRQRIALETVAALKTILGMTGSYCSTRDFCRDPNYSPTLYWRMLNLTLFQEKQESFQQVLYQ